MSRLHMEVLLLQDVANVGHKSDIVVVGDGYAMNFLLPRRMGLVATPLVRRRYAEQIKVRTEDREKERAARTGLLAALAGKQITFQKKASKTGKLYASITEKHIADALAEQLKVNVSAENIDLPEHLKNVGTHAVTVRLGDASQAVNVVVQAEAAAK